tara:strand:- start:1694 stop:2428 length:735 start_codon:yes stop_codon:yes gene_type:complete
MTFQSTVVKVAVVIFIILMVIMALMLIKGKENKKWPPETPTCPDYWKYEDGQCKDVFNLSDDTISRGEYGKWPGTLSPDKSNDDEYKCCWAKEKAQVEWDGITNNNQLCKKCEKLNWGTAEFKYDIGRSAPTIVGAKTNGQDGTIIVIDFSETIKDTDNKIEASDFTVKIKRNAAETTINQFTAAVNANGDVELMLSTANAIKKGDDVSVSYEKNTDSEKHIKSDENYSVADFNDIKVTNLITA